MSVTLEQAVDREKTAEELLGELAHQLSLLVRSELEVAAAERGPWLHRIAIELAASLGAAGAMLLALGAASLAAVEGLRLVLPGWLAALVVAVAWLGITALLLRVDHPRRLWRRLRQQTYEQTMATAFEDRSAAEADVRATAERLSHAISAEMREREARAIIAGEKRLVSTGERDAEVVLKELMSILAAPGRAGINLLERLLEGNESRRMDK
jgi:membrane protein implicated in regulation of membrane protease activity